MKRLYKTIVSALIPLVSLLPTKALSQDIKEYELRTRQEAQEIYGSNIPLNVYYDFDEMGRDVFFNTHALPSDTSIHEVGQANITIGKGRFESNNRWYIYRPVKISGQSKDETSLDVVLYSHYDISLNDLELFKREMEFNSIMSASRIILKEGTANIDNCRFKGYTTVWVNTDDTQTLFTDNNFEDISHDRAIYLRSYTPTNDDKSITLLRNTFKRANIGVYLSKDVDTRLTTNIKDCIFEDCGASVKSLYEGQLDLTGNYISITDAQTKQYRSVNYGTKRVIMTLEEALETGQIVNEGDGEIKFTGLRWRPLPYGDYNDDLDVNAIDVQECINQALGIDYGDREIADFNRDGYVDALDVQSTINSALGIPYRRVEE